MALAASLRGGFVTFPINLIGRPDLEDGDYPVLLLLDLMAWREGDRSGVVTASIDQIAKRLGKSSSTIKRSLERLERTDPPLISRSSRQSDKGWGIRPTYDRFGEPGVNMSDKQDVPVACDPDSGGQIWTPPLQLPEPVGVDGDCARGGQIWTRPDEVKSEPHFLFDNTRDHHPLDLGWGSNLTPTYPVHGIDIPGETEPFHPIAPKTVDEIILWLQCITDDERLIKSLTVKVRLWHGRLVGRQGKDPRVAVDWIVDALIASTDKSEPASYAQRLIAGYVEKGGRPGIEIPLPSRMLPEPDESDTVIPMGKSPVRKPTASQVKLQGMLDEIEVLRAKRRAEDVQGA